MSTPTLPRTLARLRQTFDSGKTRTIEWRLGQLAEIERMMHEHEDDIAEALRLDLGKCRFEAVLTEMSFVAAEREVRAQALAQVDAARNTPDGSVEAVVHGPARAVEAMIEWARKGPPLARVDRIDIGEAHGQFSGFEKRTD